MGTLYVVLIVVAILFIVRFIIIFQKAKKEGGIKQAIITFIFMLVVALVALFILKK